ncbi:MAG: FG-GAP repeat protein [Elusimicrobia bacterium]|nr:FG-GAP repeat protein [Elusimicrobiota bacterium]
MAPVIVAGAPYRDRFGIVISSADIDGDTFPDLVIGEDGPTGGNDQELFYLKNPSGDIFSGLPFTKVVVHNQFPVFRAVTVSDVIPGGCQEIIAGGNQTGSPISIFSGSLQGGANCVNWTQTPLAGANTLGNILDIRVADFNNDGLLDIVAFSGALRTSHFAGGKKHGDDPLAELRIASHEPDHGLEIHPLGRKRRSSGHEYHPRGGIGC